MCVCVVVVRYFLPAVQVPPRPVSASSSRRQLAVNTNLSDDAGHSSLLRSLSAHSSQAQSPHQQQFTPTSDGLPPRDQRSPAPRQMSCPEPQQTQPQRADFDTDELVLNKWQSCVVSHVDDPENFYCQLSGDGNAERLETLMANIDQYVTCLPPGIGKLRSATLGQPVIAKYSQDDAWYRARVTGIHRTRVFSVAFDVICCFKHDFYLSLVVPEKCCTCYCHVVCLHQYFGSIS